MRLGNLWWQHIHPAPTAMHADESCVHATLLPRWSNVEGTVSRQTVQGWLCPACHQVFTAEESRLLRGPAAAAK